VNTEFDVAPVWPRQKVAILLEVPSLPLLSPHPSPVNSSPLSALYTLYYTFLRFLLLLLPRSTSPSSLVISPVMLTNHRQNASSGKKIETHYDPQSERMERHGLTRSAKRIMSDRLWLRC